MHSILEVFTKKSNKNIMKYQNSVFSGILKVLADAVRKYNA